MSNGQNFDELYNILEGILFNKCIADINTFDLEFDDEIANIEFRYSDKMYYVRHVKSLKGELDYGYAFRSMELYTWLLREDPHHCIAELEKTIIRLT
jgi:hypothetical protein